MNQQLLHTPEGVRDIYGMEFERKLKLQETLHHQLHLYGYQDIQTPTFEFFDVFSSKIGTTPSRELYKFFDKEGNTLVLRPDFTPSIARATAKYFMSETAPIRFCYSGNTFVNTSDLQGLLKESTQLGAELIGEEHVDADGEMLALMTECMKKAGISEFQISVGHVAFFKGICEEAGIDETSEHKLREMISNKNYFGAEQVLEELKIADEMKEVILKVMDMAGASDILQHARKLVSNATSLAALEHLEQMNEVVKLYGLENHITFDLGMLSKYHYYTGVIFKAYSYGVGDAIMKGGRYDSLLQEFGKQAPAIGFVILLDQVLLALSRQKLTHQGKKEDIIILYEEETRNEAVAKAIYYRNQQVNTQLMLLGQQKQPEDYISLAKNQCVCKIIAMTHLKETEITI